MNVQIALGGMEVLTILILLILKDGVFFHFLCVCLLQFLASMFSLHISRLDSIVFLVLWPDAFNHF